MAVIIFNVAKGVINMSRESDIGRSLVDLAEIIKSNTITDVARANAEGAFELSDQQLAQLATIVGASIEKTVWNATDRIVKIATS